MGADARPRRCAIAHDQWRTNLFAPPLCWDLHTVEQFDEAARHVRPEDVRESVLRVRRPRPARRLAAGAGRARLRPDRAAPRRARTWTRSSPPSASACCRSSERVSRRAAADLWWKNAVVYCLDVETFLDADGDGCGDLPGCRERIDYLAGPRRELRLADAVLSLAPARRRLRHHRLLRRRPAARARTATSSTLVRTARDRGLRVIADLVPNHTSDQHPWFQAARERARQPVPRLLRLGRREAGGEAGRRRLPRPGEVELGLRPTRQALVPAPLLLPPARPQRRQPGRARRDRAGRGLLARAGPERLPARRRAVPDRADGDAEGRAAGSARAAARPAPLHRPPQRRGDPARRGQPPAAGRRRLLRRAQRRASST